MRHDPSTIREFAPHDGAGEPVADPAVIEWLCNRPGKRAAWAAIPVGHVVSIGGVPRLKVDHARLRYTAADGKLLDGGCHWVGEYERMGGRFRDHGDAASLTHAVRDWRANRSYYDNNGNVRLKRASTGRGPIAPCNRTLKGLGVTPAILHDLAYRHPAVEMPTPGMKGAG